MFIQTQTTPNPGTVKFLPGRDVSPDSPAEFKSLKEAKHSPLAQRLFKVPGVQAVFLGRDFVSISKDENTDWAMLKPLILAVLMEHLSLGHPIIDAEYFAVKSDLSQSDDDEIAQQIRELIETRVRPMVMMDGGDIVFDRFDDGIVYLEMRGACAGCPSSTATLKSGIETMLKHFIPEVQEVRPVQDY